MIFLGPLQWLSFIQYSTDLTWSYLISIKKKLKIQKRNQSYVGLIHAHLLGRTVRGRTQWKDFFSFLMVKTCKVCCQVMIQHLCNYQVNCWSIQYIHTALKIGHIAYRLIVVHQHTDNLHPAHSNHVLMMSELCAPFQEPKTQRPSQQPDFEPFQQPATTFSTSLSHFQLSSHLYCSNLLV